MDALLHFYPNHIEKEDKRFFHPVMDYFTRKEMDAMLEEYDAFEKELLHEKYNGMIEGFERRMVVGECPRCARASRSMCRITVRHASGFFSTLNLQHGQRQRSYETSKERTPQPCGQLSGPLRPSASSP
jgi:hypothetical protein